MRNFLLSLLLLSSASAFAVELEDLQVSEQRKRQEEDKDQLNIFRHNMNYFISGRPDTKVQFSFKMQVIRDWNLFFGYTQVMFWDIPKESSPFTDVNYNPELFYRWYMNNGMLK